MKISTSCSIGLIATLSVCLNFGLIDKASAANKSCKGVTCNDKDPVEYRCHTDARVVGRLIKTVYRWQDSWQPRRIIVRQIYSKKCNANWTKAYIPDGTFIFIREQELVDGSQPIHGLFKANGTGYFWAYGNMSNGDAVNQACVSLVGVALPFGGNSYDRYCTPFN